MTATVPSATPTDVVDDTTPTIAIAGTVQSATPPDKKDISKEKEGPKTPADSPSAIKEGSSAPSKKFTRNTPASSAAALDQRFCNSRAVLCAAGNLCLQPGHVIPRSEEEEKDNGKGSDSHTLDPADVPQKDRITNMGAVVVDATVYSRRTLRLAENSTRRARWRQAFRVANATEYGSTSDDDEDYTDDENTVFFNHRRIPNLFSAERQQLDKQWHMSYNVGEFAPQRVAVTQAWKDHGRPALARILDGSGGTGIAGSALYYDTEWNHRYGRLGDFFRSRAVVHSDKEMASNWGPHLIVTTTPDVDTFAAEFLDWRTFLHPTLRGLRACRYVGSLEERQGLRRLWSTSVGLPSDTVHVVISSYATFLQDYLHFCQVPWGTVLLDDGASLMAVSQGDTRLGRLWRKFLWSTKDHFAGLAGSIALSTSSRWDFDRLNWANDITDPALTAFMKDCLIGLTARHRILTASRMIVEEKQVDELLPVSGLVQFVAPHFAAVVQEEWDRNNIAKDAVCMDHFRRLVARYTVVYSYQTTHPTSMLELAVQALQGSLPLKDSGPSESAPSIVEDREFIDTEKIAFSRRARLAWLGTESSWLRYELGKANFAPMESAEKVSTNLQYHCEEITTASSLTVSGAAGQVVGSTAYRMAVRCDRHFSSEQGLRQHVSAQHAPPGTWLCRTCGMDCVTSQTRTHHERTCGQPPEGSGNDTGTAGATPTVGQGGLKGGVGKKKNRSSVTQTGGKNTSNEKDSDGSFRVPGYRGVWVTKQGKHFIKIDGKRYAANETENVAIIFDTVDDAAKKYDEIVSRKSNNDGKVELNFKPDGTRVIYDDSKSTTAAGVGGSAANVVPLLSVINIKDLPPDVKPLLRDPRQTSRTGGNSKRHVYAYRGVCRQSRKGHDRWQSQISFMGVNHYLGTFDSEWDAAAIYAWAHLILYGEEATRQAQKEGEEAAAAYEQEKKDIAAGKIPEPPPKPEKKKVAKTKEAKQKKEPKEKKAPKVTTPPKEKVATQKKESPSKKKEAIVAGDTTDKGTCDEKKEKQSGKKRKVLAHQESSKAPEKKPRVETKTERDAWIALLAKGASKAPILGHRTTLEKVADSDLRDMVSTRLKAVRNRPNCLSYPENLPAPAIEPLRSCFPARNPDDIDPIGTACLFGIPSNLGWNFPEFVVENELQEDVDLVQKLAVEYDVDGLNEKFRSVMQGSLCIIGQASTQMIRQFEEIGGGKIDMGAGVGSLDCHVGGTPGLCSPRAASIRYDGDVFRFTCLNDSDVVTLNGERLESGGEGSVLYNHDVCSVGPRVFVFIVPSLP
jgi:hypothetical protein